MHRNLLAGALLLAAITGNALADDLPIAADPPAFVRSSADVPAPLKPSYLAGDDRRSYNRLVTLRFRKAGVEVEHDYRTARQQMRASNGSMPAQDGQ